MNAMPKCTLIIDQCHAKMHIDYPSMPCQNAHSSYPDEYFLTLYYK